MEDMEGLQDMQVTKPLLKDNTKMTLRESNRNLTGFYCTKFKNNALFISEMDQANLSNRVPDSTKLSDDVNRNRTYAVFIPYCEKLVNC